MDPRLCIYEHFDLIFNLNINVKHKKNLYIHFKNLWRVQNAIR